MSKMTPEQFAQRFTAAARAIPKFFGRTARRVFDVVGQTATGRYMRDRGAAEPERRSRTDTGSLRSVSGDTLRATLNQPGAGGIERVRTTGLRALLTKGLRTEQAPGGLNEGRTAVSGRDLSFLAPAADDARPDIERIAAEVTVETLREALR